MLGSPPRFFIASLIEARSTRAGTPVASLSTKATVLVIRFRITITTTNNESLIQLSEAGYISLDTY